MTIVNSLLEKVTSRLNTAFLPKYRNQRNVYGIISGVLFLTLSFGIYNLLNVSDMELHANEPPFFLLEGLGALFGCLFIFGAFSHGYSNYKMVINNDTTLLADKYSQELLTIEEVNELFCLQLPNYVLHDLYSKIKDDGNLRYVELLEINKMLELGQEHYEGKKSEEEKITSNAFYTFIKNYQLNTQATATADLILQLNNKNKQHTKTFNSKKVL